jgi:hypothetical protein
MPEFLGLAIIQGSKASYEGLMKWSNFRVHHYLGGQRASYITPLLFLGILVSYIITNEAILLSHLSPYVFILNLVIWGNESNEIANAEDIDGKSNGQKNRGGINPCNRN